MRDTKPLIIALDFPDLIQAHAMLARLDPQLCRVKVGKELFTRGGPELVRRIMDAGFEVFLDLKFHDIPNTVAGAVRAAADLGVWMVNVHASGGKAMMIAAKEALLGFPGTRLIAVTVLTSMTDTDLREVGIAAAPGEQVLRLACLTHDCGLDGVVCSAQEIDILRAAIGQQFLLVTPGIRPAGDLAGDQKRIETPGRALARGGSFLVIGRPVTQAKDPAGKLREIMAEISGTIA